MIGLKKDVFRMKRYALPTLLLPAALLLLARPQEAAAGVRAGLTLCADSLIPTLFPFLAFCAFFSRSGADALLGHLLSPVSSALFRLPGAALGAVVFGLTGGCPVGLRMTAQLLENGRISREQATRMALFCTGAGPAFVFGLIGGAAGHILFAALTVSALLMGFALRFRGEKSPKAPPLPAPPMPPDAALVGAVSDAITAMAGICAWVILFCALRALLPLDAFPPSLGRTFHLLWEIGGGGRAAAGIPLPLLAAAIAWGGLCVHCQLFALVRACGQSLPHFLLARAIHAALSAGLCAALLRMFPLVQPTLSNHVTPLPAALSRSAPAAAALLLTGALLILDGGGASHKNC